MPEVDEFQILLSSPEVAEKLDKKYGLLHDIFRDSWDAKNNRWAQPNSARPGFIDRIVMAMGGVPKEGLDYYDLANFLGSNMSFSKGVFGAVGGISMNTARPEDAKRWIGIVLYEVSDIIRSQMINERQNYVNYLQQQLSQATLTTRDATIAYSRTIPRLMVLKSAKTFPLEQIQPSDARTIPDQQIPIAFCDVRHIRPD